MRLSVELSDPLSGVSCQVRDSEITADVAEQLRQVSPKLTSLIESHGEADPALLGELFKVMVVGVPDGVDVAGPCPGPGG